MLKRDKNERKNTNFCYTKSCFHAFFSPQGPFSGCSEAFSHTTQPSSADGVCSVAISTFIWALQGLLVHLVRSFFFFFSTTVSWLENELSASTFQANVGEKRVLKVLRKKGIWTSTIQISSICWGNITIDFTLDIRSPIQAPKNPSDETIWRRKTHWLITHEHAKAIQPNQWHRYCLILWSQKTNKGWEPQI